MSKPTLVINELRKLDNPVFEKELDAIIMMADREVAETEKRLEEQEMLFMKIGEIAQDKNLMDKFQQASSSFPRLNIKQTAIDALKQKLAEAEEESLQNTRLRPRPKVEINKKEVVTENPRKFVNQIKKVRKEYSDHSTDINKEFKNFSQKSTDDTNKLFQAWEYPKHIFYEKKVYFNSKEIEKQADENADDYFNKQQEEDDEDISEEKAADDNEQNKIKEFKMDDTKYKQKNYDFNKLRQNKYVPIFKSIDHARFQNNHPFLSQLSDMPDGDFYNYANLPKFYRFLEKLSNVRGNQLTVQNVNDPFPYYDMGDLPQRLMYNQPSLHSAEELDLIDTLAPELQPGKFLDDLAFSALILGYKPNFRKMDNEIAEKVQIDRFTSQIGSKDYLDELMNQRKMQKVRQVDNLEEIEESYVEEPSIVGLKGTRTIKYTSGHETGLPGDSASAPVMKDVFAEADLPITADQEAKSMTADDFNSIYSEVLFRKKRLPKVLSREDENVKEYRQSLEGLTDLVITVNQTEVDKSMFSSLDAKIKFMTKEVKGFQGVYVGSYYCLEIVKFILSEYYFLINGMKIAEIKKLDIKQVEVDEAPKMEPQSEFGSTVDKLKKFCQGRYGIR